MANQQQVGYLLSSLETVKESTDKHQQVNEFRKLSSQLYATVLQSNDERLASAILEQHCNDYQKLMIDPESINNYCDDVMELLNQLPEDDEEEFDATETTLSDPAKYVHRTDCRGQYENCTADEISESALRLIIARAEPQDTRSTIRQQSLRPDVATPVAATVSKVDCSAVQEISKRVFGSGNSVFAPKVPITKPQAKVTEQRDGRNPQMDRPKEQSEAGFRTAKDELHIQNIKKYGTANPPGKAPLFSYGKKSLGGRRALGGKFVCPVRADAQEQTTNGRRTAENAHSPISSQEDSQEEEIDERLRHIEPKMVELIRSEIMDRFQPLSWDDIAGLEYAKSIIQEAVVWPILRPDIFTGLRKPPRGILLFGPPGTGKTLIGKCIASQSKSTFFSISASSLTSKWIGDGEKMVRALFAVAAVHQPAVVFIDEIDSLLCQRSDTEHESSRRLKTEFLVQLDGAATAEDERILIVGATNRPQELDEAARRRLVKRLYIPLPELPAREQILTRLLQTERNCLTREDITSIGTLTEGFSGADMKVLCHEASMGPIRSIPFEQLGAIGKDQVRPIQYEDFRLALCKVKASVSPNDLQQYVVWDRTYGAGAT